jgi:hypothetical protein
LVEGADLADWLDEEGRPLGEVKASPSVRAQVAMATARCPYAGSRSGHALPMNVSAERQIGNHWRDTLALLAAVRTAVVRDGEDPTDLELYQIAHAGELLPRYWRLTTTSQGASAVIPVTLAAVYKVCAGLRFSLERRFLEQVLGRGEVSARSSAETLYAYADERGHFIGHSQVCAGTPRQILDTLQVLKSGGASSPLPVDPHGLAAYSALLGDFEAWKWTFAAARSALVRELVLTTRTSGQDVTDDGAFVEWLRLVVTLDQDVRPLGPPLGESAPAAELLASRVKPLLRSSRWDKESLGSALEDAVRPLPGPPAAPATDAAAAVQLSPRLRAHVSGLAARYAKLQEVYVRGLEQQEEALAQVLGRELRDGALPDRTYEWLVGTRVSRFFSSQLSLPEAGPSTGSG